VTIDT